MRLLAGILFCASAWGQIFPFPGPVASGGSGPSTPTLMGSISVQTNSTTSATVNTSASGTGGAAARLLVCWGVCYGASTAPTTPTDSCGNTYTPATYYQNGYAGANGQFFYTTAPNACTASATALTWSNTGGSACTNGYMFCGAFSGTGAFEAGSDQGATITGTTTLNIPSFTPSQTNDLVLSAVATYDGTMVLGTHPAVNNSMTIPAAWFTNVNTAGDGVVAWTVYNSTSAMSVSWTNSYGFAPAAGAVIAFKHQ